ncbi:hypothetical protein D3C79_781060 [compost metagenome]
MTAEDLAEAGQLLADDRRRRQRQARAQHQGHVGLHAEQNQQSGEEQAGADHLQAAEAKHHLAQGEHFRQGKFQSQGKQQKDHAHLSQVRQLFTFVDPVQGGRADEQADTQIAKYRRQFQAPEERDDDQR